MYSLDQHSMQQKAPIWMWQIKPVTVPPAELL